MSDRTIDVKYNGRIIKYTADEYAKDICKIGQDADCCKYLTVGGTGYYCCKVKPEDKKLIDDSWDDSKSAQSDNCDGVILNE